MIKKLIHWLSHKLKTNSGKVVGWHENNILYVGFQCDQCGEIQGKQMSITNLKDDDDSIIETK